MYPSFRWNGWNVDHVATHGVSLAEAEQVVRQAKSPYPQRIGEGKLEVYGGGQGNRLVHVVFILDDDGGIYIIHARPVVKSSEKRRVRGRSK